MNLDFKTVRALSSPTRIKILRESLETEATTTHLSKKVGKSKSTVSSHLEKLVEAKLLEKDKKKGRKRVVYRPTKKSKAIVEGRTKKVKFSIASSAITALTGLALVWPSLGGASRNNAGSYQDSGDAGIMMEEAAKDTATDAGYAEPFLLASLLLFTISISALLYGLVLRALEDS